MIVPINEKLKIKSEELKIAEECKMKIGKNAGLFV
jgi:hypothetical protein